MDSRLCAIAVVSCALRDMLCNMLHDMLRDMLRNMLHDMLRNMLHDMLRNMLHDIYFLLTSIGGRPLHCVWRVLEV